MRLTLIFRDEFPFKSNITICLVLLKVIRNATLELAVCKNNPKILKCEMNFL